MDVKYCNKITFIFIIVFHCSYFKKKKLKKDFH